MNEFDILFRKKLLETFRFTIKFLEEYGLKWYVCGGTAIGAVRHKGMIPWDDDIDICMPREDYNRLIGLQKEIQGSGYDIVSISNTENYYLPFAKIIDTQTTLWERKEFSFLLGVYVDIFPIELTNISQQEFENVLHTFHKKKTRHQLAVADYDIKDMIDKFLHFNLIKFRKRLSSILINRHFTNRLRQAFLQYEASLNHEDGHYYILPTGTFWIKEHYPREWFDSYIEMPFEDFSVHVPKGYHEYLTQCYGDYMTPPPIEQRNQKHEDLRHYINLRERITLEEAKKRIKDGHTIEF